MLHIDCIWKMSSQRGIIREVNLPRPGACEKAAVMLYVETAVQSAVCVQIKSTLL